MIKIPSINNNADILQMWFPNELTLNRSEFNRLDQRVDKISLAQTIQNLLIIKKGTYPNQPELGIGIEEYMFELASEDVIRDLEYSIDEQIKKFIPTNYNIEFEVDTDNKYSKKGLSVLSITFTINDNENDGSSFQLLFGKSDRENKLVSRLLA